MPSVSSFATLTCEAAIGAQKLGQPVPESNLVSELNSGSPQAAQR